MIADWIEIVRAGDFRFCSNLREVFAGLQREIGCFRDGRKLECVELSRSVEVSRRDAFGTDENEDCRGTDTEAGRALWPLFLTTGGESWLQRRRRGCYPFIARNSTEEEEENRQVALSRITSQVTMKCGNNVHDSCAAEITARSVSDADGPRNSTDLGPDSFCWPVDEPSHAFGFNGGDLNCQGTWESGRPVPRSGQNNRLLQKKSRLSFS
jgi:hypothetical protein